MQDQKDIIDCYDKIAENYAAKFLHELDNKHLDQILLKAFAEQNKDNGKLIDFGCGPGQTTSYLSNNGIQNVLGTDLSIEMVNIAKRLNPHIQFEQADLVQLHYSDNSFSSAIAFYAIVHFDYQQLRKAFSEVKRVLSFNGEFLFSFHIGNEIQTFDKFLDKDVKIKFHFFQIDKIRSIIDEVGLDIIDVVTRHPYKDEHQTQRCYIWTKNRR